LARRRVPVIRELRPHLHRQLQQVDWSEGLLFGRTPAVPFEPSSLRTRAIRDWRAAGLTPLGLHECRHTFASVLIAAGVNAKTLCTYMGHASITTTYDLYGHLMPGNENEAVALVDAYLAGALGRSQSDQSAE